MDDQKKKMAAAFSAVMAYIKSEEDALCMRAAASAPASPAAALTTLTPPPPRPAAGWTAATGDTDNLPQPPRTWADLAGPEAAQISTARTDPIARGGVQTPPPAPGRGTGGGPAESTRA